MFRSNVRNQKTRTLIFNFQKSRIGGHARQKMTTFHKWITNYSKNDQNCITINKNDERNR